MDPVIAAELEKARAAQGAGRAGRARVGARRAAGWAARAYYQRQTGAGWGGDELAALTRLQADPALPMPLRAAAARLTTVVDLDHTLPFAEDPLADAQAIIAYCAQTESAPGRSATA